MILIAANYDYTSNTYIEYYTVKFMGTNSLAICFMCAESILWVNFRDPRKIIYFAIIKVFENCCVGD